MTTQAILISPVITFLIVGLQEEVFGHINDMPGQSYKLVLNSWEFVFRKVPNSHDFYFDIKSDDFKIVEEQTILEVDEPLVKMIDLPEVKYPKNLSLGTSLRLGREER